MNTLLLTSPELVASPEVVIVFLGSIRGYVLTADNLTDVPLTPGAVISDLNGDIAEGTTVTSQISGPPGGNGTYMVKTANGRSQVVNNQTMLATTAAIAGGWDLTVDVDGNIATATGAYAIAQDVSSACRTFLGELWYDVTFGVPYFQQVLDHLPPLAFVKQKLIAVGMSVPGVASIAAFLTGPSPGRSIGGQLQITSTDATLSVLNTQTLGDLWYVSGGDANSGASA